MSVTAGVGRILNGSGGDRVKRTNLLEFRGELWESVNDWFFGYTAVDYDWSDAADASKFAQWTFSADANMVAQVNVLPADHHVEIVGASGDADGLSNLREVHTIPETATWGVAHSQCEIVGSSYLTGNTLDEDRMDVKPQHGLCLRAQEDAKRRTIIAWHDVAFGLPQSINLGVWSGNLDGTGFLNRQINLAMELDENYTPTACEQTCDDDAGLVFDGTVANWSTPDHADLEVGAGDWCYKADVTISDWTPAAQTSIFSKYTTVGNQRSYRSYITTAGAPVVVTSSDGNGGASLTTITCDAAGTAIVAALSNGARRTLAVDYDADNGSGNRAVTFYLGETWMGPWTQLGATITVTGTSTPFNGTATMELGAVNGTLGERLNGRIHRFELRKARLDLDGDAGTAPVADVRPQWETDAVTSFTDHAGRTWTRAGTASLANTVVPTGTATIGTHTLRVGDRVNIGVGDELSVTALQRTNGQDCQCTLPGGHSMATGSLARLLFSSDSSFDGLFVVTVSGNTMTWVDAGTNTSGQTSTLWDQTWDRQTATVTAVSATTIDYSTFGMTNAAIPVAAFSKVQREFPYYMEMKVEGTVASVRCWGRHQSVPDWMDQDRALICDMAKAARTFNVTFRERTSNVATLTIGTHDLMIGDRINIASVEASFNATNRIVTAFTATTVSYANTGSDVGSTASSGTVSAVGSGTASAIIDNPCPVGSGRVGFVNAHLGTNDLSRCVYGPFFGDNDPASQVLALSLEAGTTPLDVAFSFPTPTAGQAGTPATPTPAVVPGAFAMPAAGESVGAGPAVVAQSFAAPQAVASAGSTVSPAVASLAFSLAQAVGSVGAGPAVVPSSFVLPAAAESVGAAPSVIARALTLPSAAVAVGAAPAVVPAAFAVPVVSLVTEGNVTALPAALAVVAAFPQAATLTGATVSPAVVAGLAALGQAGLSVGAGPSVLAQALGFPQATPETSGNVTVTPVVVAGSAVVPAVALNVAAVPSVLARALVIDQATVSLPAVVSPVVVARALALPGVTAVVDALPAPAVVAGALAFVQPAVGVTVGASVLGVLLVFPVTDSGQADPPAWLITAGGPWPAGLAADPLAQWAIGTIGE